MRHSYLTRWWPIQLANWGCSYSVSLWVSDFCCSIQESMSDRLNRHCPRTLKAGISARWAIVETVSSATFSSFATSGKVRISSATYQASAEALHDIQCSRLVVVANHCWARGYFRSRNSDCGMPAPDRGCGRSPASLFRAPRRVAAAGLRRQAVPGRRGRKSRPAGRRRTA